MSSRNRRRRLLAAGLLGPALALALAAPAQAAEGARITDVATPDGQVTFLVSGIGLAPGESLDPATVTVSIADQDVPVVSVTDAGGAVDRTTYLVMDTSGSMEGQPLAAAKDAGRQYLDTVPDDVAVGLITFADDAAVAVPATTDRAAVSAALDGARAEGSTALFDAAALAVQQLGTEGSRSIVMLSDGEDEGSTVAEAEALAAVTSSGASLDAVALKDGAGADQLGRLALAGGGVLAQPSDPASLTAAFESAATATATQLAVTTSLPAGQSAGTVPLAVSVEAAGQVLTDQTVLLIDEGTAVAAANANAAQAEPIPAQISGSALAQQAWFLPLLMVVLFAAFAMIALLAFRLIKDEALQPRRLRRQINSYGFEQTTVSPASQRVDNAFAARAVEMAQQAVDQRDEGRTLERKLSTAQIPLKPGEWVVLHATIAFTAVLLAAALTGFNLLWVLMAALLGAFIPYAVLDIRATRRRKEFYQSLPEVLQLLAGGIASGYSFPQAIDTVASQTTGVVSDEFNRAVAQSRLGVPIEDALDEVAQRMDSRDFEWVVMAVRINRQVGGNLAEVLRTVAKTLRERERVRRQVAALTAEGKLSAWILGLLPFGIAAYLMVVNPEYLMLLFSSPLGWVMMFVAAALMVVGVFWLKNLIKVEV